MTAQLGVAGGIRGGRTRQMADPIDGAEVAGQIRTDREMHQMSYFGTLAL
jgi:hypothetical protein